MNFYHFGEVSYRRKCLSLIKYNNEKKIRTERSRGVDYHCNYKLVKNIDLELETGDRRPTLYSIRVNIEV